MTRREIERFIKKHLLPSFPGWEAKGVQMFMRPVGDLYRAIGFQVSSSSVYVSATVYPLFVPADHLGALSFGDRIGSESSAVLLASPQPVAKRIVEMIAGPGMRMIERYDTLEKIISNADLRRGPHAQEAVAYSYVLLRQPEPADLHLAAAIDAMREYVTRPVHGDWGEVMLQRLEHVRSLLHRDVGQAQAILKIWTAETAEKTGLARFR